MSLMMHRCRGSEFREAGCSVLLSCLVILSSASAAAAQEPASVQRVMFSRDVVISGVYCAASGRIKAGLYPSGRLQSCSLRTAQVVGVHSLPAGAWVYLTESGTIRRAWLPNDSPIQGVLCKGSGHGGWSVDFLPSGALKSCFPGTDLDFEGIPCRGASFVAELLGVTQVVLHENGRLAECSARRDISSEGITIKKRHRIKLDEQGYVIAQTSH